MTNCTNLTSASRIREHIYQHMTEGSKTSNAEIVQQLTVGTHFQLAPAVLQLWHPPLRSESASGCLQCADPFLPCSSLAHGSKLARTSVPCLTPCSSGVMTAHMSRPTSALIYSSERELIHPATVICTANSLRITTTAPRITTAQTPGFVIISGETSENPRPQNQNNRNWHQFGRE